MSRQSNQPTPEARPEADAPSDAALHDTALDQVSGGMQNFWKAVSDMLKSQSDTQSKIAGNFR